MITAQLLAECSELVYLRIGERSQDWKARAYSDLEAMRIKPIVMWDHAETQGFVGLHYNHRITCFRGTDSRSELLTNLMARRVDDRFIPNVKIHRMFASQVDEAMGKIESVVDYADNQFVDWFTGHSLGGAMAQIAAARVQWQNEATHARLLPVNLVTHSSPRAGNRAFAKYLADHVPHVRWQRAGDPVPMVPLWPLYAHSCPPVFFDSGSDFRPSASFWTRVFAHAASVCSQKSVAQWSQLHSIRDLRRMIMSVEASSRTQNILSELLDG